MSEITSLNFADFRSLIKKFGLEKTWINVLATHISSNPKFEYILNSPEFKGFKLLKKDLIKNLTIGEVSVLYEFSVSFKNNKSRKSNGQFFTPDDVSKFMANFSHNFPNGKWMDPCSGIGNLSWHLINTQKDSEKFLSQSIILSDKDSLALLIARTLLTISFQKYTKNLFNTIKPNFIKFDFLSVAENKYNKKGLDAIPKHDFVIVNPPYLAITADDRFETAKSADLYAYFLENIIKTSKGFISITPQSFTNANKFRSLRKLLLDSFDSLTIYNFDNVPGNIFKGIKFGSKNTNRSNSIRAAITLAVPGKGKRQITSLIRWKSNERSQLFSCAEKLLSDVALSEDFFPKVEKDFKNLFDETRHFVTLKDICTEKVTKYPLFIPSSPRYFIVALKNKVKRSSQKTIYFVNANDRNYAYLLINSSFMYWWWRVRDGGMTLSMETIFSLPCPAFKIDNKIIDQLEESEKTNKVYKQNAGAKQENVKHTRDLLNKLNKLVTPRYYQKLIELHDNSDIEQLITK